MNFFKQKKIKIAAMALLGLMGFVLAFAVCVGPATALSTVPHSAASSQHNSSHDTAPAPDITVEASSVGSFQFHLKGTILTDVHLKGTQKHSPKCGWANGYNGYAMVNGHWVYRYEKHVHYCPNKNSPTGNAKIGGGDTGKDCENPFKPGHHAPGPVFHGKFTELPSLHIHKVVKAWAYAAVHGQCPNIDVSGDASASSLVSQVIDSKLLIESKGSASHLKVLITEDLKEKGVVKAMARLHLNCNVPPPTTTTVTTSTTETTTTTTPPPTFTMVFDTLNQITAPGCKLDTLHVTTSVAGRIKIYPANGLISTVDCYQPDTGQLSEVTPSVGVGDNNVVVYVYESSDPTINSDTLTAVPLISGVDAKSNTVTTSFTVTHPIRPAPRGGGLFLSRIATLVAK